MKSVRKETETVAESDSDLPGGAATASIAVEAHELDRALARVMMMSLPPVCLGLAALYLFFAVGHVFMLPPEAVAPMVICAAASAILLFSLFVILKIGVVTERVAMPLSALVTVVVIVNTVLNFYLVPNLRETTNFILVILGSSMLVLSTRWLCAVIALTVGGWWLVVWSLPPSPDFGHFAFGLVTSLVLGGLVHTVRMRTTRRAERLLILDERQKEHLRIAAQRAEHTRQLAEEANRAKSMFLANMSHEIRTPMNGIVGMTDLVLESRLDANQRECLNMVQSSAETLLHLINDILDFSKIEAGRMELEMVEFSIEKVISEVVTPLRPEAERKGLGLKVNLGEHLPDLVIGDPIRVGQVLRNLLSNAIKFTEEGEILVSVRAVAADRTHHLEWSVKDSGIGIPTGKLEHIFESFTQADGSTTREYGGTGLGLAISSELVSLMGGRISVESEIGTGSTFSFSLDFTR